MILVVPFLCRQRVKTCWNLVFMYKYCKYGIAGFNVYLDGRVGLVWQELGTDLSNQHVCVREWMRIVAAET